MRYFDKVLCLGICLAKDFLFHYQATVSQYDNPSICIVASRCQNWASRQTSARMTMGVHPLRNECRVPDTLVHLVALGYHHYMCYCLPRT